MRGGGDAGGFGRVEGLRGWVRWILDVSTCVFERRMWGFLDM